MRVVILSEGGLDGRAATLAGELRVLGHPSVVTGDERAALALLVDGKADALFAPLAIARSGGRAADVAGRFWLRCPWLPIAFTSDLAPTDPRLDEARPLGPLLFGSHTLEDLDDVVAELSGRVGAADGASGAAPGHDVG